MAKGGQLMTTKTEKKADMKKNGWVECFQGDLRFLCFGGGVFSEGEAGGIEGRECESKGRHETK